MNCPKCKNIMRSEFVINKPTLFEKWLNPFKKTKQYIVSYCDNCGYTKNIVAKKK